MTKTVAQTIDAVRAIYSEVFGLPCSFHLSPCPQCNAPGWQQPCPMCGYYPQYGRPTKAEIAAHKKVTREEYAARVSRRGGIGVWYFNEFQKTVAYKQDTGFRAELNIAIAKAMDIDAATGEEIWDACQPAAPTKIAATMALTMLANTKLRSFTDADWDCFAGCGSDHPLIGTHGVAGGTECTIVVDGERLSIYGADGELAFDGAMVATR